MAAVRDEASDLTALVSLAQSGADGAMETLVHRFRDRIAGFVYSLIGNDDAIEDLCHIVFVKMITKIHSLKQPGSFEAWLFRIARNVCNDFLRKQRLQRLFVPFEAKHEPIAADPMPMDYRVAAFQAALEKLPRKQKELILLVTDNDWSYQQLAEITGSTIGAVKSRLFRAREFLKGQLTDET